MFTYTTSKKKLLRIIITVLAVIAAAGIIFTAVMSSMKVAAAERKIPIYSVQRADSKIAVTFDCAWGNSNTDLLLQILKEANAKATFFVTGEFCDKYPEDVKKMYDAGHEIGNHSDVHPHTEGMNINDLIADTKACSDKIKMITGEAPTLYRAPYGEYDDIVVTTVEGMGMKVIQWSVDSIDWEEPSADVIIRRVTEKAQAGSIILFHNDLENTAEALPSLLTELTRKGHTFCTVSDMIYEENYHIDNNGMQIYDAPALVPTFKYSDNALIDEAMEIIRQNFTLQEIYDMSGGAMSEMREEIASLLTQEQLDAIAEASFDELKSAVENLIAVAEAEGAGENAGETTADTSDEIPDESTGGDYYEETAESASEAPAESASQSAELSPDKGNAVTTSAAASFPEETAAQTSGEAARITANESEPEEIK